MYVIIYSKNIQFLINDNKECKAVSIILVKRNVNIAKKWIKKVKKISQSLKNDGFWVNKTIVS